MKGTAKGIKAGDVTPHETGHYQRYPEEEFIDELENVGNSPERAGADLAEEFSAVTGRAGRTSGQND